MNKRYIIAKNEEQNDLIIRELGETDPGVFSMLCEQRYDLETITTLAGENPEMIVNEIRNVNFYPSVYFAKLLKNGIVKFLITEPTDNLRIECTDIDALTIKEEAPTELIEEEKELVEIDKLLEDDDDDDSADIVE